MIKLSKNWVRVVVIAALTTLSIVGMVYAQPEVTLISVGALGGWLGGETNNNRKTEE